MDESHARHAWPRTLVEMTDVIEHRMTRDGMSPDEAARLSCNIIAELSNYFGGRQFYLPRGEKLERSLRDAEVFKLSGRVKVLEISERFNLTQAQIYNIIKKQRELRRRTHAGATNV